MRTLINEKQKKIEGFQCFQYFNPFLTQSKAKDEIEHRIMYIKESFFGFKGLFFYIKT